MAMQGRMSQGRSGHMLQLTRWRQWKLGPRLVLSWIRGLLRNWGRHRVLSMCSFVSWKLMMCSWVMVQKKTVARFLWSQAGVGGGLWRWQGSGYLVHAGCKVNPCEVHWLWRCGKGMRTEKSKKVIHWWQQSFQRVCGAADLNIAYGPAECCWSMLQDCNHGNALLDLTCGRGPIS